MKIVNKKATLAVTKSHSPEDRTTLLLKVLSPTASRPPEYIFPTCLASFLVGQSTIILSNRPLQPGTRREFEAERLAGSVRDRPMTPRPAGTGRKIFCFHGIMLCCRKTKKHNMTWQEKVSKGFQFSSVSPITSS